MSYIPVLHQVFDSNHRGRSLPMSLAEPHHVLERIRLCKLFVEKLNIAITSPIPNQNSREFIQDLIADTQEEIEELYDYYLAKIRIQCEHPHSRT